jgi:hypothetical protein
MIPFSGYYFNDPANLQCQNCGLMILYASGGQIGHWEMTSQAGGTFAPFMLGFTALDLLQPCLQKSSVTFRGTMLPTDCAGNCTGNDTMRVAVCPPNGYIRFVRDDGITGWSAIESLSVKILFLVYEATQKNTSDVTSMSIAAPNCDEDVSKKNSNYG